MQQRLSHNIMSSFINSLYPHSLNHSLILQPWHHQPQFSSSERSKASTTILNTLFNQAQYYIDIVNTECRINVCLLSLRSPSGLRRAAGRYLAAENKPRSQPCTWGKHTITLWYPRGKHTITLYYLKNKYTLTLHSTSKEQTHRNITFWIQKQRHHNNIFWMTLTNAFIQRANKP